jgi:hypothetical protein
LAHRRLLQQGAHILLAVCRSVRRLFCLDQQLDQLLEALGQLLRRRPAGALCRDRAVCLLSQAFLQDWCLSVSYLTCWVSCYGARQLRCAVLHASPPQGCSLSSHHTSCNAPVLQTPLPTLQRDASTRRQATCRQVRQSGARCMS